jgi:ribosomal protein S19E (S16A)
LFFSYIGCYLRVSSIILAVEYKVEKAIKSKPRGSLLFPDDFSQKGSAESVRKALQSLKEKGLIKTVAHGIYVRPVIDEYIGEVIPTAEEVAKAIAKRDKIKMLPTGAYALNALGLSTQIPLKLVFLTDGAPRTIAVGQRTIKLKKTTPRNLKARGKISSLVIQALREIGKDNATEEELKRIIALLQQEDQSDLKHDIALAPEWIKKIMKQAVYD